MRHAERAEATEGGKRERGRGESRRRSFVSLKAPAIINAPLPYWAAVQRCPFYFKGPQQGASPPKKRVEGGACGGAKGEKTVRPKEPKRASVCRAEWPSSKIGAGGVATPFTASI